LMEHLNCADEESVRKKLSSNKQFAEILTLSGIKPPMKVSPVTGRKTFALAKNDEGFIALTEHEDPIVQQLCAVRLGTRSTIEESRIERFIEIGKRNRSRLPVPLRYYGAHTGRWSGLDKVNFQNLPSRDKRKKALKNAVVAPPGHVIINCDSSQIEARVLAWLAGQDDVTEQFAKGEDVYSIFASKIYRRPISKTNPTERFVGKTCILGLGYGTGAAKLQHTLKTQPPGADLPFEECKSIVNLYRTENYKITELWRDCDNALQQLMVGSGPAIQIGNRKAVWVDSDIGIQLPNGMYIRYANLRRNAENKVIYDSREGPITIWGGAVVENIVQALARIVVGEQMIWISKHYRPVLTVHDAVVLCVPKNELDQAMEYITLCMSTPPPWAKGLPVACEAKFGRSYGEC
jgi:DNA polymerase I-like protein with 3'-5' exonuclease and polymerase domains